MAQAASIIPAPPEPPIRIAISECLTGKAVRYDGSDAWSSFPHAALDGLFSYVPICPEVGIGMDVPRPPIRLVGTPDAPRVVGVGDPTVDVTESLARFARARSAHLETVCGYVFMERSPSCGLYSVPVYAPDGGKPVSRTGRGGYARPVLERYPLLPVEENGRLFDAGIRESFIARVFAYAHWRRLCATAPTPGRLIEFHSRYKYLLMAHSIEHYRRAGRLLGAWQKPAIKGRPDAASAQDVRAALRLVAKRYMECLLAGLGKPATRGGHANALSHIQGYLSGRLADSERHELTALIEDYRRGQVLLTVPRDLLLRHLASFPQPYLAKQIYLQPTWSGDIGPAPDTLPKTPSGTAYSRNLRSSS